MDACETDVVDGREELDSELHCGWPLTHLEHTGAAELHCGSPSTYSERAAAEVELFRVVWAVENDCVLAGAGVRLGKLTVQCVL